MKPPLYPASPARARRLFSSGVRGQIQPRNSIRIPHRAQGRCTAATQGRRHATNPPTTTKTMNSACATTTAFASRRYGTLGNKAKLPARPEPDGEWDALLRTRFTSRRTCSLVRTSSTPCRRSARTRRTDRRAPPDRWPTAARHPHRPTGPSRHHHGARPPDGHRRRR